MQTHRLLLWLAVVASFLAVVPARLAAQGSDLGAIRGTVTDPTGAIVLKAQITITDLATNTSRKATTNSQGNFEMFGLKSGNYTVTVTADGFRTEEITGIVLNGSDTFSANAVLQVGTTQSSIMVTSEAPVIHTEDQTISQTLDNQAVIELPRDSRDVYQFLYLNPNITQGAAAGEFKFIGSQSYGASFSLDGQRSNGGIFGDHTASEPTLEAVSEVNVMSNDFSAEYAGIANIRITTKRGGADYHGSVLYNNKNSALAAWTLQDKNGAANFAPTSFQNQYPNPFFNITDLGGSFGGPVPKVKNTWFFAAYERNWTVTPTTIYSNTLPHPTLLAGDFSLLNDSAKPSVPAGVTLTPGEIAADTVGGQGQQFIRIPDRLLNPTVQKLIGVYYPHIGAGAPINPNNGRVPGFATLLPGFSNQDLGTFRLDHDFTERDRVYLVYNTSDQGSATSPVVAPYTGLGLTQNDRLNQTVSASYTRIAKPNLVNEVRGGFNLQNLFRHSNTTLDSFLTSVGFTDADVKAYGDVVGPLALGSFGHPAISLSGTFANFTNGGRNTNRPLNQNLATFGDTLTWVIGKHNLRMGGDIVYDQATDGFALNRGNPRGAITYTGSGANPLTRLLLGLAPNTVSYVLQPRPAMDVHNWEQGFFVQDDWKIHPKLTLNLGVRYELITPFIDANDLIANFDPNYVNPTTGKLGRFVIPSNKTLKYLDTRIINYGYVLADQSGLGVGRGVVRMDTNNIAPRAGLAWRITDRTVLRGGYGVYYPTSAAQGIRDPIATNPFNQGVTKRGSAADPIEGWPGNGLTGVSPVSGGALQGFGNTPAVNVVPFGLQSPRIQQWNVTLEREIGWQTSVRLSYLGTHMSGLIAGNDLNEIRPSNTPFGTTTGDGVTPCDPNNGNCDFSPADLARERFPGLGDFVLSYGNFGHGASNAFQAQVDHRYSKGLMFSFSYTYLDQKSTALDTGNSSLGGIAYNAYNPTADYGTDGFVSRHRVVAYGIYDLPVGRSRKYGSSLNKWADAIVGGWQSTFNMFAKSGTGFTPFWLCDNCGPAVPGNIGITSLDAVGDFNSEPSYRPLVLSNNFNQKSGDRIWNPAAFGLPSVGADVFSNPAVAKRNMLMGPGTWGVNLGVHKDFRFSERVKAQIGADVDNLFNHPLFSPDSNYGGGGGPFAFLGDFNINVDQKTAKLLPITDVTPNPDFGRLINSFSQEGIDNRRTVRLRLRITW
jgi:Carboxypeptidase regulatory-like domain/TonB dependent receptor